MLIAVIFRTVRDESRVPDVASGRPAGSSGACGAGTFGHMRAAPDGWIARLSGAWLRWRMLSAIRMREMRFSIPAALTRGLRSGLPIAAILAATVPVWGMSW